MDTLNKQFLLAKRPEGNPKLSDWEYREAALPELQNGQVLLRTEMISLDPAMRGWMNPTATYVEPVKLGDVMRANAISEVIDSRHSAFKAGDKVQAYTGIQSRAVCNGDDLNLPNFDPAIPYSYYLGVLGIAGLTAYYGLTRIGKPQSGETVVISGAAGAVGSTAGQIAKIHGCKVYGLAGSEAKCRYLTDELGFDGALNYRDADFAAQFKNAFADGIDIFFDNVGGAILDLALCNLAINGRIVLCGAISEYNNADGARGIKKYVNLIIKRALMQGLIVSDFREDYPNARREIETWIKAGQLQVKEHIVEGIENFPETFMYLFEGKNNGKLLLRNTD